MPEICVPLQDGRRFCVPLYAYLPWWWSPDPGPERRNVSDLEQIAALAAVAQLPSRVREPIGPLQDVARAAGAALREAVKSLGEGVDLVGFDQRES